MTTNEMRKALNEYCKIQEACGDCQLYEKIPGCNFGIPDEDVVKVYAVMAGYEDKAVEQQEPVELVKQIATDRESVFREITTRMAEVYRAKNHDYGNSFAKLREKYPISILIRLADKLNRLDTLLMGDAAKVKDESIDDTLLDLANYAVMELVERRLER